MLVHSLSSFTKTLSIDDDDPRQGRITNLHTRYTFTLLDLQ